MAETKITWGCINADGTLHSGDGNVDITHIGNGAYMVNFREPFSITPSVVLTQNFRDWDDFEYGGGDTRDNCVLIAVDRFKFKVVTGKSNGDHTDRNFTFIAIGFA
jgi:hypothetical protein